MIGNKAERVFSCSGNKVNYVSGFLVYEWLGKLEKFESCNEIYCIRQYEGLAELAMQEEYYDTALFSYIKVFELSLGYDWKHRCMRNKDAAFKAAYKIKFIYEKFDTGINSSYYVDEVKDFYLDLYCLIYNID